MKNLKFLTLALAFSIGACSFSPKRYDSESQGFWQAKALVKDKRQGRSFIVNLDMNAIAQKSLRMDVTAAMGEHVASLVTNENNVEYYLVREKKFYTGRAGAQALKPILSVPLDPIWVQNILFDQPIANKDWVCTKDAKGYLQDCKQSGSGLSIRWGERKGNRKTVFVEHPSADVQMNFYAFKPKVEERSKLFDLSAPKGFETLEIP